MRVSLSHLICLGLSAALLFFAGTAWAGPDIKQRMTRRLPVITDLKARGVVGETNRGYLGFVGGSRESASVVAEENKDRKTIYRRIASENSVSIDRVEKRRARILAEKTPRGQYYQNGAGAWVKK